MLDILFLIIIYIVINIIKTEKLIFVELQSRHGARAPLNLDGEGLDYLGEKWENPGELTGSGQRMEYLLGLRNRQRYIIDKYNFLSERYNPHELLVYCSEFNRTMISMIAQLQGLYPMYAKGGDNLTQKQIDESIPPFNISCDEIKKEIINLNDSALPNYMTAIPIHQINYIEKRFVNYINEDCKQKVNETLENNKKTKKIIIDSGNYFNNKYSEKLSKFYTKNPKDFKYDFDWILSFCDTLISDFSEGKTLEKFIKATGIEIEPLLDECTEMITVNYRDEICGDEENNILLLESPLLKEMVHYMKLRVDADIKGEIIENNITDYSRPKMIIISGHDVTITFQIMYMIKYFGFDVNLYRLPTYTSQIAYELKRINDENINNLKYNDYKVFFYFNDDELFNITFDKFVEVIEKNSWNLEQINDYCIGYNNNQEEGEGLKKEIIVIIILGIFSFILLIAVIIMGIMLRKSKNNINYEKGLISDGEELKFSSSGRNS